MLHRILLPILLACAAPSTLASAAEAPPLFVVHFATGPGWVAGMAPAEQAGFADHSANLQRLRKAGRIVFGARYEDVGLVFLRADSLEAARAELDADPGVVAGIFTYTLAPMRVFYPWQEAAPPPRP